MVRSLEHSVAKHGAASRGDSPLRPPAEAAGADGGDREPDVAAVRAPLQAKLADQPAGPERPGQVGDGRLRLEGHRGAPRIRQLDVFSVMPRPVTRQVRAPATCRSPHSPRSWRTPSTTCSQPCMYDSDRFPPAVLTGSSPSSAMRSPPSTNGPDSPGPQNPACSSQNSTAIVKLS